MDVGGGVIKNESTHGGWKGNITSVEGGIGVEDLDLIIGIGNEKGITIEELIVNARLELDHLPKDIYIYIYI